MSQSDEYCLPGLQVAAFLFCPQVAERKGKTGKERERGREREREGERERERKLETSGMSL